MLWVLYYDEKMHMVGHEQGVANSERVEALSTREYTEPDKADIRSGGKGQALFCACTELNKCAVNKYFRVL